MNELFLVLLFIGTALVGYKIISHVPSLLHTPLMSGMNALSGIPLLGAIQAFHNDLTIISIILCLLGVFIASINIIGGFGITGRMLKMFKSSRG